jgi:2-oxo-4-hydroxy-4-carboxy-5-ureidoimidazoline decarboxylase
MVRPMTAQRLTLDQLNAAPAGEFIAALAEVFERAPWVAAAVAPSRPFATVTGLHRAMMAVLQAAPREQQLAFVRGHPELGSRVARARDLTADSRFEQGSLGLDRLNEQEFGRFQSLNDTYHEKFGFPFIICVRRHTRDSLLARFERRVANDSEAEFRTALEEIALITRLRLVAKVDGPGQPTTEGRLSTHVLDQVCGRPAADMAVALYEIGASARGLVATATTNRDGRTEAPLIAGEPLRIGCYELQFGVGDYFARQGGSGPAVSFLDVVPIRFSISEPEGHYHVPLLVTPFSYATYRGH